MRHLPSQNPLHPRLLPRIHPGYEQALHRPREDASPAAVMLVHEAESPAVIQEIAVDDGSDGYFDYGKFEKAASPAPLPPSPADEAVKKVKEKTDPEERAGVKEPAARLDRLTCKGNGIGVARSG